MHNIIKIVLCFSILLNLFSYKSEFNASEIIANEEMEVIIDLNTCQIGDSIVLYEDQVTGGKLKIDFLEVKNARYITGTGSWSQGYIPSYVVKMYVHYETPIEPSPQYEYVDIGYYVTYDGGRKVIMETYGATIGVNNADISNLQTRIITSSPTASVPAKSEMTWILEDVSGNSLSSYLRQEINIQNQMRIAWRF